MENENRGKCDPTSREITLGENLTGISEIIVEIGTIVTDISIKLEGPTPTVIPGDHNKLDPISILSRTEKSFAELRCLHRELERISRLLS